MKVTAWCTCSVSSSSKSVTVSSASIAPADGYSNRKMSVPQHHIPPNWRIPHKPTPPPEREKKWEGLLFLPCQWSPAEEERPSPFALLCNHTIFVKDTFKDKGFLGLLGETPQAAEEAAILVGVPVVDVVSCFI